MSADTSQGRADTETSPPRSRQRPGMILLGVVLVAVGVGWLLDTVGAIDMRWRTALPAALILVGVGLLATARRGAPGGLIAAGIVLGVLVVVNTFVPAMSVVGGVGEREVRPAAAAEVQPSYDLSVGSLTIDLRDIDHGGTPVVVQARVGVGEIVLRLPEDASADVRGRSGIGEVDVLGASRLGFGASLDEVIDGTGPGRFDLELSVGIGRIEVTR